MWSVCELLNQVSDWGHVSNNHFLENYAEKVHDTWHGYEDEIRAEPYETCKKTIDVLCSDIVRAIDKWMEASYGDAKAKS